MKRIVLLVFAFAILNGCAEYSSLLGPSYTVAKSGSVAQVGSSMAASYGFEKATGQNPSTFINSLVRKSNRINSFLVEQENPRECQTIHSTKLNEIFFTTLDEFDCFIDPFSILR